ncbi:unnamed protein product [Wuchereria bancrofti]|uniref:Uncharacterized protein n=1 Tax=Wuchereria bancrofti TaxID=6293 RepID=A0A3P7E625_WUCBA|nr:unnamed protein product [Wuchereria bancrofti]
MSRPSKFQYTVSTITCPFAFLLFIDKYSNNSKMSIQLFLYADVLLVVDAICHNGWASEATYVEPSRWTTVTVLKVELICVVYVVSESSLFTKTTIKIAALTRGQRFLRQRANQLKAVCPCYNMVQQIPLTSTQSQVSSNIYKLRRCTVLFRIS